MGGQHPGTSLQGWLRVAAPALEYRESRPSFTAWVEGENNYLGVPRQAFEHAHMVWRQRADTEHQHALGQFGDRCGVIQAGEQFFQQTRAVRVAVTGQLAPQQRLPGFIRAEVLLLIALPGGQPVVAIQQVLVEYVGDLHGK